MSNPFSKVKPSVPRSSYHVFQVPIKGLSRVFFNSDEYSLYPKNQKECVPAFK